MTERHNWLQAGNQLYQQGGLDDGTWAFDAFNTASLDASPFSLSSGTPVISPGAAGPSQVVFIDSGAPDIADLINGALPGEQIFVLDPTQDGLDQIASILKANDLSGLSAISIVGHGASGEIDLGSAVIDDSNLGHDAAALSVIGASLAPGGDLALYACDTAAGAVGHQFIADLSAYAGGADVAAATHLVGSADLGGSWTLDASTEPAATAPAPFTASALADYNGVLGTQPGRIFLTTSNTEVISIDVNGSAGTTTATTLATAATTSNFHLSLYGIASDTASGKYFVVDETALSGSSSTILAGNISGGGGAVTPIYTSAVGGGIYGMRFDPQNSKLYFAQVDPGWPSVTAATGIYTINEDGTLPTKLVSFTGADSATTFAIDTADNLLFFTNGGFNTNPVETVEVANLTTGAIISTNLFSIDPTTSQLVGGIDVDPANHKIYWTTSDPHVSGNNEVFSATFITGASVTLSNIAPIYTGSVTSQPFDVSIDVADGIFYTADDSNGSLTLVEGNLNGTGSPTTVYTSSGLSPVFMSLELTPTLTLTLSSTAPPALEGGPAVPLVSAATVVDSAQDIASATVSITGGLASGDTLSFENGANHVTFADGHTISASFSNGVLSLTGDATAADYQSALETIAFSTTSSSSADRTISWSVSDGNLSSATSTSTVHVQGPPAVTSESHTSSSGSHIDAGKTVTFTVAFSSAVNVTTGANGAPTLQLNDSEVATYSSGSGTNTLIFSYTVQPSDTVTDLKATSFVALPTGTTIKDGSGQAADLSGFTAIDSGVQVDTTAPSVTSVGVPANGTYIAGQDLDFTVQLSEAVTVTGTPEIALTLDTGGPVDATYVSGSGTSTLVFSYAVIGGKADTNGIGVGNAIILNGGTVQDAATNAAVLTLNNVGSTSGVLVDAIPPTVASVSVPTDGVYSIGQALAFTVHFSENVLVTPGGGAPYIDVTLDTGGTVRAVYTGGSGTPDLTFSYTIASGNDDANGIAVGSAINLNGGTIKDAATNTAVLTLNSVGSTTGVLVDAVPPTVSSIHTVDSSTNNLDTEHFTVTFSAPVNGVDASDFTLVGTGTVNGAITSVSGSGTTWTVTVGNVTGDGTLRLDLNNSGDPITDNYGNTLTAAHTGDQSYTIEHTPPAAPTLALTHDNGGSNTDHLTNDPSITYSMSAAGDTLLYKVDGGSYSATAPVFATDHTADGLHTVSVEEVDAAGNVSTAASLSFTLDTTAPAAPTLALTHDTGASNTDNITSDPSLTYSTPAAGDTLLYKVDGGSYLATAPVFATDHTADGLHTVSVEEVDAAGNVSTAANLSFTLDTAAPAAPTLALTHDNGVSNTDHVTSDPSITYSMSAAGDTLLYKVDGGSYSATAPVFATDHTADGLHTVSVEEVDAAGNVSTAASLSFTLDTTAPAAPTLALTHDTGASNTDNITSDPSLTYSTPAAGDTLLYKVDGGSYLATAPVFATDHTADGLHTVSVEEVDAAGNVSTAASLSFTLDTTPPAVVSSIALGASPNNASSDQYTVKFSEVVTGVDASDFTATRSGTVADAGISVSGSGTTYTVTVNSVTGDGTLRLDLNASGTGITDTAGNAISSGFTGGDVYAIQHTAPSAPTLALTHDTGVSNTDNVTSDPSITYSTPAAGDTLLYTVDGGSYSTTVPVFATDHSADGSHTVSVEEVDAAGNISTAASLTFMLDTIAPAAPTLALTHDNGGSNTDHLTNDPSITYSMSAAGDTLLYKVDGGSYSATVPVFATDHTADGLHTVSVEEVDAAGNVSTAASLSFTLDTTAPAAPTLALTHDTGASNTDHLTSDPSITYSTPAAGDMLLYKVDGGSYSATVPVFATDHSADGSHTVSVEEVDAAGNVSTAASLSFTLDTTAPAAPTLALTHDTGVSNTDNITSDPSITYSTPLAGDTLLYKVDGGSYSATVPVFATDHSADGSHTVSVEEVDAAGNVSTAASLSFTLDTIAPAAPTLALTHDTGVSSTDHLTNDPSITYSMSAAGDTLLYKVDGGSYSAAVPVFATDHSADGSHTVSVEEVDAAGNVSTAASLSFTLDTIATAVAAASPSSGTEVIGDLVQITLTFGEAVTIAGSTPALALNDGGTATYDAAATAVLHDASKLVFDYTVASSDGNSSPLAITGVAHGTTITDLAGNAAGVAATFTGLGVVTSLVTANPDTNHVVANQTVTVDAAHGVLANDPDTNPADHVVVSAVDGLAADVGQPIAGAYGTLTLHADGSYVYAADNAVTGEGTDTFTYTASNGHGPDSTSTLTITVSGANQSYVQVPSGGSATAGYNNTVLDGSAGGATLTAVATFNAHQILVGGPGDILNAASFGQDTFVFADNFGHETINNFHPALDVIQLQQSQFGSLAAVMADIQQVGADSVLTLDANHIITITNTPHTSLTASDFHLV